MKTSEVIADLKRRFPGEPEYYQAVQEVLESIEDVYNEHPEFENSNLVERLCIPEPAIFRRSDSAPHCFADPERYKKAFPSFGTDCGFP